FPYESDKINVAEQLQYAYVWAGERLIEIDQAWEALAVFEGLRSRALLDLLGLSKAVQPALKIPEDMRAEGERLLDALRTTAFPREGTVALGMREAWISKIEALDSWLASIEDIDAEYAHIVQGRAMTPKEIYHWAESVARPTAVVFWFLGEHYSYQAVLY